MANEERRLAADWYPDRGAKRSRRTRLHSTLGASVDEFLVAKRASGRAAATVDCYRVRLGRLTSFLGEQALESVTPSELRGWLLSLKRGLRGRPTTGVYVEGHRLVASVFFDWAVARGPPRPVPNG